MQFKTNDSPIVAFVIMEGAMNPIDDKPAKLIKEIDGRVVSENILQSADIENRNKRLYPKNELFPVLQQERIVEYLATSGVPAENGHPMDQSPIRQQTIDPNNVVAYHIKLWTENNLIKSHTIGSELPIGEAFDRDLRKGKKHAWSFRGTGTIVNVNGRAEAHSIIGITWDRVFFPSHPEAYTTGVINESGIFIPKGYDYETPIPDSVSNQKLNESGILTPLRTQDVMDYIKQKCNNLKMVRESFDLYYDEISLAENGQIQLKDAQYGQVYYVDMERHLHNEMMDYATRKLNGTCLY